MPYEIDMFGELFVGKKSYWKLTFCDTEENYSEFDFNRGQFNDLIDKIDELTYGKKLVYVLHREELGKDPFVISSANQLQWYIQNAPTWGSIGQYFLFSFNTWEEAYETALSLQERFDNCHK